MIITSKGFYKGEDEFKKSQAAYSDRFRIEWKKTEDPDSYLSQVEGELEAAQRKEPDFTPENVIVQLPAGFQDGSYADKLTSLARRYQGIKFMVIDTEGLTQEADPNNRVKYRGVALSALLLSRNITEETRTDSNLYRLLEYFITSLIGEDKAASVPGYISAIMRNDIASVVRTVLTCTPMIKLDAPDPAIVAAALMSA